MYERSHLKVLTDRINEPRRFIQVLMGPRQVGKTTVVTQLLQKLNINTHFVSADYVLISDSFWLEQQWEIARLKIKTSFRKEFLLVIDEIQKVTNWSEKVKLLWVYF
ncbi:AAA family ATPase [Dyadobacter sp. 3J3]|uniref:AAA family ATPase n=1 Tax=Dyadobacter sp. 3J3 TaxID=2606600 RepID=UPI001E5BBDD1|nr:AAA family ATPase [Dyadobacter sp. 3J3]